MVESLADALSGNPEYKTETAAEVVANTGTGEGGGAPTPNADAEKAQADEALRLAAEQAGITTNQLPNTREFFNDPEFEFEKWEDLKAALPTRFKSAKETETYKKAAEEANLRLEELRQVNQNPFVNEDVAALNEFVKKTNINNFQVYQRVKDMDLTNADPVEIMVQEMVVSNPALIGKEEALRNEISKKFGLVYESDEPTEEEKTSVSIRREMLKGQEAKAAGERLAKLKESAKYTPVDAEAVKTQMLEQRTARVNELKPLIEKGLSEIDKMQFFKPVKEGETPELLFEHTVDKTKISQYTSEMLDHYVNAGVKLSDKLSAADVIKSARQAAENRYTLEHNKQIIADIYEAIDSKKTLEYDEKYSNVNGFKPRTESASGTGVKTEAQMYDEMIAASQVHAQA